MWIKQKIKAFIRYIFLRLKLARFIFTPKMYMYIYTLFITIDCAWFSSGFQNFYKGKFYFKFWISRVFAFKKIRICLSNGFTKVNECEKLIELLIWRENCLKQKNCLCILQASTGTERSYWKDYANWKSYKNTTIQSSQKYICIIKIYNKTPKFVQQHGRFYMCVFSNKQQATAF